MSGLGSTLDRTLYRAKLVDEYPFCMYCNQKVTWKKSTLDHVIPTARGGEDTKLNVVLCCRQCNATKADRLIEEWIDDLRDAAEQLKVRFALAGNEGSDERTTRATGTIGK